MATQFISRSSVPPRYNHMRNRNNGRKREGIYQFTKEQTYEGEFLRNSLHGLGTYNWLNVALYDGGFYSNCKEGYASLSFPDSSYFEGLFVGNQPFGPGILTHPNGRQDAGFWKGRKLVRLSRAVDFIIPRLAPTSAAKIKLLQFRRLIPVEEDNASVTDILQKYHHPENISAPFSTEIYDPRSIFFDKLTFERAYFASPGRRMELPNSPSFSGQLEEEKDESEEQEDSPGEELKEDAIPSHCVCPTDVFVMEYEKEDSVDICERESFAGENEMGILGYFNKFGTGEKLPDEEDEENHSSEKRVEEDISRKDYSNIPKIVSWNRSELCTEMLKQIFRFRNFEGNLNFNLSKLMVGARTAFRKTGENEMQCLQFLKMCSLGPAHVVKGILCSFQISEELMDARGNNSLMFAAATDKHDVIELLLNYGVDKNSFNDEGLTPLNLCLLRRLAYAYGISNWETAFLPKEIDESQYEDIHVEGYPIAESISSLDRIFGDGMSLDESNILGFKSSIMSPLPSPSTGGRGSLERKHQDHKDISKTTLGMSPSKTQASLSVINWEWEFRPGKSVSIVAVSNPTPTLNVKIIPKSLRRDEFQRSLQRSSKDKYLFEISFEKKPALEKEESHNSFRRKQNKKEEELKSEEEPIEDSMTLDFDPKERIAEIDKTIQLLLDKGADPNISEVPKPSIHLAIYTKDLKTVQNLLKHGADPNSVLHSNEGLLTPLHVIVLQKPTQEYVHICDLLLNYKANPDKETLPGFSINEDEKQYLDSEQGRTPLHLLCMRPDLEYTDPNGYLIKIGLMLARASHKKHFYNGHSYLTLAMLFGNMKLLQALLSSEVFDPKDVLGKDRGTCLHVLVSGELQHRTSYDTSKQMCDLLIRAGADPLKTFKNPRHLLGTCVDYGYRELGMLREARNSEEFRGFKRTFSKGRDSLLDHERVLEYLATVVGETARQKHKLFLEVGRFQRYKPSTDRWRHRGMGKRQRGTSDGMENLSSATFLESDDRLAKGSKDRDQSVEEKVSKLILPSSRLKNKSALQDKKETQDKKEEKDKKDVQDKKEEKDKKDVQDKKEEKDKKEKHGKKEVQDKREKQGKEDMEQKKMLAEESEKSPKKREERKGKRADRSITKAHDEAENQVRRKRSSDKDVEEAGFRKKKTKKGEGKFSSGKDKSEKTDNLSLTRLKESKPATHKTKTKREGKSASADVEKEGSPTSWKDTVRGKFSRRGTVQDVSPGKSQPTKKKKSLTEDQKEVSKKRRESEKQTEERRSKKGERQVPEKKESLGDRKAETDRKEQSREAKERDKGQGAGRTSRPSLGTRERGSYAPGAERASLRTVAEGRTSATEVFPENLRQVLLRMYGNCVNMDVNEFLMPYVVLRDGQLYYKFKGKATKQKEQYSLI